MYFLSSELMTRTGAIEDNNKENNGNAETTSVLQHDNSCIKLKEKQAGTYYQFQNSFQYEEQ